MNENRTVAVAVDWESEYAEAENRLIDANKKIARATDEYEQLKCRLAEITEKYERTISNKNLDISNLNADNQSLSSRINELKIFEEFYYGVFKNDKPVLIKVG